jgi:hypothetical protein
MSLLRDRSDTATSDGGTSGGGSGVEGGRGTLLFLADAVQGILNVCNPSMAFMRQEMEHTAASEV